LTGRSGALAPEHGVDWYARVREIRQVWFAHVATRYASEKEK